MNWYGKQVCWATSFYVDVKNYYHNLADYMNSEG